MTALAAAAAGPGAAIAFEFDLAAVFTGLLFALVMSELLRIAQVAVMVALLVAGGLVWTLFEGGAPGVTALVERAVVHLETSATTGFLTGALLGKSLSALLAGLRHAAAGPLRRGRAPSWPDHPRPQGRGHGGRGKPPKDRAPKGSGDDKSAGSHSRGGGDRRRGSRSR